MGNVPKLGARFGEKSLDLGTRVTGLGNVPKSGARVGDKSFGLGTRIFGMGTRVGDKFPRVGECPQIRVKGW